MIRLAVIFESSPFDRKGLFNAVHNRVKHLAALDRCEIDVFCIHSRDNAFTRYVRHTPQTPDVESVEIEGISYRMLWYEFSMTDHMMLEILHVRPLYFRSFIRRCLGQLEGYDIVSAHSFTGSLLAYKAHQMYGIPYFVTWHGSDVHTHPWRIPVILEDTARIMENAVCNFFVSRSLLETSDRITVRASKEVLRNGVSEDFFRYDAEKVDRLRKVFGLEEGTKVVAFVGNMSRIKNVHMLPSIFSEVRSRYGNRLMFWIVGDGKERGRVEDGIRRSGFSADDVRFWGNQPAGLMPDIMNCIDVLVLPSRNEGLPLVCAEALSCGANVVGAHVGGIPEIIGEDNCIPHGETFVGRMADRIVTMLETKVAQTVPADMDWSVSAGQEWKLMDSFE